MAETDPAVVGLLFDSGHLTFAGIDPLPVLKKHIGRIQHVHLKDVRLPIRDQARKEGWSFLEAVKNGVFTVPGDGDVDFAPIFDVLAENGYEGWVVVEAEQDPAKANPFEYAVKARKYIAEKTGCKRMYPGGRCQKVQRPLFLHGMSGAEGGKRNMTERELALRYAPIVHFDENETIPLQAVGYTVATRTVRSRSFPKREIVVPMGARPV
jgi:hypothetical protein